MTPPFHWGLSSPVLPYIPLDSPSEPQCFSVRISTIVLVGISCFFNQNRMAFSVTPQSAAISAADRFLSAYSTKSHALSQYGFFFRQCCPGLNSVSGLALFPFVNCPFEFLISPLYHSTVDNTKYGGRCNGLTAHQALYRVRLRLLALSYAAPYSVPPSVQPTLLNSTTQTHGLPYMIRPLPVRKFSGVGLDDVVAAGGHNWIISKITGFCPHDSLRIISPSSSPYSMLLLPMTRTVSPM